MIARDRFGFRIGDVDVVARVDEDAARPAELGPLLDERAVLIENLNAVVVAIADEQAPFGVERERVRLIEFAGRGTGLTPPLDQLAVLRELQHLRLALAVALGHEDVAVSSDDDVVRLERNARIGTPPGSPSVIRSLPSGLNLNT